MVMVWNYFEFRLLGSATVYVRPRLVIESQLIKTTNAFVSMFSGYWKALMASSLPHGKVTVVGRQGTNLLISPPRYGLPSIP